MYASCTAIYDFINLLVANNEKQRTVNAVVNATLNNRYTACLTATVNLVVPSSSRQG